MPALRTPGMPTAGLRTAAIVVLALVAGAGLAACAGGGDGGSKAATPIQLAASGDSDLPVVRVSGEGEVEGTPDVMTISIGVQTIDASAQAAMKRNNERAAALIDSLKKQGVDADDIQTTQLSVSPNYDDDGHVTGYSVSNRVSAKLRDISKAGAVIDTAAASAGDDIRLDGVQFSIDDTSDLVAAARAKAVEDATNRARQLADAAGIELGAIRLIDDTGTRLPQPEYYRGFAADEQAAAAVPIEPGTQELTVAVTVVFDIKS